MDDRTAEADHARRLYADAQVELDAAVSDRLRALDALEAAHVHPADAWPGPSVVLSCASAAAAGALFRLQRARQTVRGLEHRLQIPDLVDDDDLFDDDDDVVSPHP